MKRRCLAVLILGLCLPLTAQRSPGLKAHIPFDFEAADRVMPAGDYRLNTLPVWPGIILIENQDLRDSAFVAANLQPADVLTPGETNVAFNRYEDRYFLARVTFLDRNCGVVKSRSERELVTSKIVRTGAVRPVEVKIMATVR